MANRDVLLELATRPTLLERIVDRLMETTDRIRTEDELTGYAGRRRRSAAAANFGQIDTLLIGISEEQDGLILAAREALGIRTRTPADHVARLEERGPWLAELEIPDSRTWRIAEVAPGRWFQIHDEHRLMSIPFPSEAAARKDRMRGEEPVLRKMRERHEEAFGPPAPTPEP